MGKPGASSNLLEEFRSIQDRYWRLYNLYYILDANGNRVKFRMNWAQTQLLRDAEYLNVVLKARQMGFSTFIDILMLDACLFNSNTNGSVIDKTLNDAKKKLKEKILYPYDNLPEAIRQAIPLKTRNAESVVWENGSKIEVGTSLRGGTAQFMHISELGPVAARTPSKAEEIRSGAFNAVAAGQTIFVESTAEGREGVFFDICETAQSHVGPLSPLDFKFHFFPWWMDPKYQLENEVTIPSRLQDYFTKLLAEGIKLTNKQKWWYVRKEDQQRDNMKREFPSFPEEAFEASMEGTFFSRYMADAAEQERIGKFPYNREYPVHTFWDIGKRDNTAIWFVQFIAGWVRLIDYYQVNGISSVRHFARVLKDKQYIYGKHWFPHDIRAQSWGMDSSRIEQLLDAGIEPEIVPNLSNEDQLESAYVVFKYCQFNEETTEIGRKCLRSFRKEWDPDLGVFKKDYLHDWASDGAKAFMYMGVVYKTEDAKIIKDRPVLVVPELQTKTFNDVLEIQKSPSWQRNGRI